MRIATLINAKIMKITDQNMLVYPKLSYRLIGLSYEIFNKLGPRHLEKVYQKAFSELLKRNKIEFKEQLYLPIKIDDKIISRYFLDFLICNKVIIEIKTGNKIHKRDYQQIRAYLKEHNLRLGILILFSPVEVKFKRILNPLE